MRKNRREFCKLAVAVGGAPALIALLPSARGEAQDLPQVAENDPIAVALGYVHDATKSTHARYQAGQTCANCQQLQGEAGKPWRPCTIFPGKVVAEAGWCSVWVQKAS
jgi:hypothetical protein